MNLLSQTNPLLLTNMSNEFNINDMKDNVDYQYALKDLGSSNEIPKAFLNKPRMVKEIHSVGGFRIPEESLKKRIEPSSYMPLLGQSANAGGFSSNLNADGYNMGASNANLWVEDNHNIDYLAKHSGDASLSENLISVFEQEVQKLKKEAQSRFSGSSFANPGYSENQQNEIQEDKTYTEYLAFNPSRVQAIKHVTTNFKPEYLTLEEIQRQREEHLKILLKTENEFYEKKKFADRNIDSFNTMNLNMNSDKFGTGIPNSSQMNSSAFNMQEVNALINHEEQHFNKSIRSKPQRGRTANKLIKYNDTYDRCLSKGESKYIKKFMNYLLKKKYKEANDQDFNDKEDWNTTRVRSLNRKSVNLSKDGPGRLDTGHLDKKDYSLYYLSIESDSPRSLSLKSGSSRTYSGQKINRKKIRAQQLSETHPVQYGSSHKSTRYIDSNEMSKANYNKSNTNFNSTVKSSSKAFSSSLAFAKMIFNLLDVGRVGTIKITELEKTMNLDHKIMVDLGFENQEEFMKELRKFQTAVEGEVNEDEFCGFLLSKSQHCEEYLYSYMQGNLQGSAFVNQTTSKIPVQIQEYSENLDSRQGSMLRTNKSFNGLASQTLSKYNTSKSAQYMMNLKRQIVNDKLKISYNDYKEFVKGYKARKELNVTIPNAPSFYDKKGKREKKMQEIIDERKKQEDEVLGYRFKPNELKREIFISQLGNIIEAEKAKRSMRQEKIKQKIVQEMRPFSFYDTDEKKYKEKLLKECCPPEFLPFKANPIPWTSQVNLYEDIITKQEKDREARIEERARQNLQIAKLPPRMELHDKKKKLQEDEIKNLEKNTTKSTIRSKSTSKVARVPDFAKEHENFIKEMEKKKSIAKPTEPKPFTFHEPKVFLFINIIL